MAPRDDSGNRQLLRLAVVFLGAFGFAAWGSSITPSAFGFLSQDEGAGTTAATTFNCVGAGISCATSGGVTTATVGAGGGGISSTLPLGETPNAAGLSISGTTIQGQPASATMPGMVIADGGTQTFNVTPSFVNGANSGSMGPVFQNTNQTPGAGIDFSINSAVSTVANYVTYSRQHIYGGALGGGNDDNYTTAATTWGAINSGLSPTTQYFSLGFRPSQNDGVLALFSDLRDNGLTNGEVIVVFERGGNVGINKANPTVPLDVYGAATVSGTFTAADIVGTTSFNLNNNSNALTQYITTNSSAGSGAATGFTASTTGGALTMLATGADWSPDNGILADEAGAIYTNLLAGGLGIGTYDDEPVTWYQNNTSVGGVSDTGAVYNVGGLRLNSAGGGSQPTCEAATRGTIWYTAGGVGVADVWEKCHKDAGNNYAWAAL